MLKYIDIISNKKYSLITNNEWINDIKYNNVLLNNDVYQKYDVELNLKGELIICNDLTKESVFCKKICKETYSEYLEDIKKRNFEKEKWIYNIIDGIEEQNNILYRDNDIVIIPSFTWKQNEKENMHILAIVTDKNIRTIRDLNVIHIDLLNHIKIKTLDIIYSKYGFKENDLKMFIHYTPSTYLLHIHFTLLINININSSVEYSHELSSVIFNLSIDSDYYKKITINKRI
jgi:m7GpppX diphosphatase